MGHSISTQTVNPPGIRMLMVALALFVIAAMIRIPSASLIDFDDDLFVSDNAHVLNGLTAPDIAWAFTTNETGNWMPLTWLSLQLDATLSGPAVPRSPGQMIGPRPGSVIYHLDNLFQHICGALLLFLFLERATRRRWMSFAVALLWAIHPLRVESVAWITERKDVLAGLFGFLSLYLYVRWNEKHQRTAYAGACASLVLSLLAKPLFVTLPFAFLLLDFWPLGRLARWRELWPRVREKSVLFVIIIGASIVALLAQNSARAVMALGSATISERLENALLSYVRYLWMHVDIVNLALFYPYLGPAALWKILAAAGLLIAVTVLTIHERRRRPWLLVGWFWYLGTFVPVIGLVQIGQQAYADRYTYLPAVGLLIMLCYSIPARWLERKSSRIGLLAGLGLIALLLAGFTLRQVEFWQDPLTLDQHTLAITRSNYVITAAMGNGYRTASLDAI
jgi:hypothetical protein